MDEAIEMHPKLIGTAPSVDAAPSQNPLCPPTKTVATKAHHHHPCRVQRSARVITPRHRAESDDA